VGCFNADASLLIQVGGCLHRDVDFDGTSYQPDWSGTLTDATLDARLHVQSFLFTSPTTNGHNYERVAFEADLPAIEFANGCDVTTGAGCVNPPPGAAFYPLYSTTGHGACAWQEGGTHIPRTTNTVGGTSTAEYGPLLGLVNAPIPGFTTTTTTLYEDFRNVLASNPCPSNGHLPHDHEQE
jgi:hypothetical protein